ncbi:hypothetical protein NDU88_001811 [Pleurodeles waltl]|uniref:Uncharacterized protein n=1 Tax=Pleurodeles waltl TaxID=8319 RepID=A0AAV7T0M9_PLEWA|nr:hypothetical protein NDU88_001811 [Pleurodeles waltl]
MTLREAKDGGLSPPLSSEEAPWWTPSCVLTTTWATDACTPGLARLLSPRCCVARLSRLLTEITQFTERDLSGAEGGKGEGPCSRSSSVPPGLRCTNSREGRAQVGEIAVWALYGRW